jgi:hypothetical protein
LSINWDTIGQNPKHFSLSCSTATLVLVTARSVNIIAAARHSKEYRPQE